MKEFKLMMRKALALLLVFAMCTSLMSVTALADDVEDEEDEEETRELICGLEESDGHVHGDECYDRTADPICGQEESAGHVHSEDCYARTIQVGCNKEESDGHAHDESCYDEEGSLICGLEESEGHHHSYACAVAVLTDNLICGKEAGEGAHTHTNECYPLVCGKEAGEGAHTHTEDCYRTVGGEEEDTGDDESYDEDNGIATIDLASNERSDLWDMVKDVTITDEAGNKVTDGKLQIGEKYHIHIEFEEGGLQSLQFSTAGTLTYQFPGFFEMDPKTDKIIVKISEKDYELDYTVDENGLLTIILPAEAQNAFRESNNVKMSFDMDATAQKSDGSGSVGGSFGGAGEDFTFEVTDQPRVKVEKNGVYTEHEDHNGCTLSYTVKVTVEHGKLLDATVEDILTPPENSAFELEGPKGVTVTLERDGEDITLTKESDYNYVETEGDPEHPQDKAFRVQISDSLQEGDVLYVTYTYAANVTKPNLHLWANMENVATFTGYMPVENPDESGKETVIPVEEKDTDSCEIRVTPVGHGVVCKDQSYSEATKTLHYTLYTVVPAGKWTPLNIYDDMYTGYNGENWYLSEFGGKVKNLTVSAVDVPNWFDWDDSTTASDKIADMQELKDSAEKLTGYKYDGWTDVKEYDSTSLNNYLYYFDQKSLYIIFGEPGGTWGDWGTWEYETDRLIITEYDLDMSATDPMTLHQYDYSTTGETITTDLKRTPEEVLRAGITNNVNLRYSGYFPGYSVFFNNADDMIKTGELDKEKGTIDYTVTINTTDSTVKKYFHDVVEEWYGMGKECEWNFDNMYSRSMQAVFYDVLPAGWEYVKGSLYAVARGQYNMQEFNTLKCDSPLDQDENICVSLAAFQDVSGATGNCELLNWFKGDAMTSLEFHYTLKATDEWLEEHATADKPVPVYNHAEIKDKNMTHWSADKTIEYYPAKLTKKAEQVEEDANLLRFTIEINPEGVDYDPENENLVITDTSTNLEIRTDTIKVRNAAGEEVDYEILPAEGSQFKIKVPDSMALTITYDAIILEEGPGVAVSNTASIDGVALSDSGYSETLNVSKIYGSGGGSTYELTVKKTDETGTKSLAGAKFDLYVIRTEDSALDETTSLTVNGKQYSVHTEDSWKNNVTDTNGSFTIGGGAVEPGNYYILLETEAPEGYQKLEKPILFYYGFESEMKSKEYPGVVHAPSILTVKNEPNPEIALEVEKKIEGIDTTDEVFTFVLSGTEGEIERVTVTGEDTAYFESISYPEAGTYEYTISEVKGKGENWTYDETVWNVTVTVAKDDGGKLTASAVYTKDGETADHATFTNTYTQKLGSLTITKTVVGGGEEAANKTYTFTVTGPSYPDGHEVTITGSNSETLTGLKPGTYTVTEANADIEGWTLEVPGEKTATVVYDAVAEVTVTNTYTQKLGSLKITKSVVGDSDEALSKEYSFTVTGPNEYSESFTLKNGDKKLLENLPIGEYAITEGDAKIEGYTLTVDGDGTKTVEYNKTNEVTITNKYERDHGDLTVKKTMNVPAGFPLTEKTLTFDIEAVEAAVSGDQYVNGEAVRVKLNGTFDLVNGESKVDTVTFVNGWAEIKLTVTRADGWNNSVTIKDLPTGVYVVKELKAGQDVQDYVVTVENQFTSSTVVKDGNTAVVVTNNYKLDEGEFTLKFTKTVKANHGTPIDRVFTFNITGTTVSGASVNETVTVKSNSTSEIQLKPGKYTVTETGDTAIEGFTWNGVHFNGQPGSWTVEFHGNAGDTQRVVTVEAVNSYTEDLGSLTITKAVTGNAPTSHTDSKEFTFTVTGPEGYSETVTVTGNGSVTLKNLAPGKYTVTEDRDDAEIDGYTLAVDVDGTKTVTYDKVAEVTVTNTYTQKRGSLKITKAVVGGGEEAKDKTYTFTVTGPSYPDGTTVTVKGNDSETLNDLIPGDYTVTEDRATAKIEGYELKVDGEETKTVTYKDVANVTVTNTYTQKLGSLKIAKSVEGVETGDKEFTFTVTGPSYPEGTTVTVKGNDSTTLKDLVPGDYTVAEVRATAEIEGYELKVEGEGTATVAYEDVATVTVTNTYTQKLGSLKITKTVVDGGEEAKDKTYTFTVTGPSYPEGTTVTVKGNDSTTLKDLVPGDYTVTEVRATAEIEGYELKVEGEETKTVTYKDVANVTVTNTYRKLGGLKITKSVVGGGDEAAGKIYTFDITGPDEYTNTVTVTGSGSVTVSDLAPGEYTVTERSADIKGYELTVSGDKTANVTYEDVANVSVINTYTEKPGSLKLTKAVAGGGDEAAKKVYTFTVTGPDGYSETVTITGNGSATLDNLKPGVYKVTEENADIEGYNLAVSGEGDVTVVAEKEAPVTVTNSYTEQKSPKGALTVTKTIEGDADEAANKTYTFDITGPDGYTNTVSVTGNGSVTLEELVPGEYTVTERDANIEGYNLTVTGGGKVTVEAERTGTVTVTNKYERKLGSLTVVKVVEGDADEAAGKTYTFDITGPEGYNNTVSVTGNGSVTVSDLVPGEYTVTERDAGIEGYNLTVSGGGNVTVEAEKTATATVTNTYERKLGSLTVNKVVVGGGDEAASKTYTFEITGPEGYSSTVTVTGTGSVTVSGLVPGEYTVIEADASIGGWSWSVTGEGNVTVEAEAEADVTVTNTYTRTQTPTGSLTIEKAVVGGGDEAASKVYTFNVTGPNGYSETVTVTGSGRQVLRNLRPGQYTVTEADASMEGWSWTVTGEGEVTVSSGRTASVTVTNTYTENETPKGSLTVSKTVVGGGDEAAEKVYTFNVTGPDGYSETVTVTGSGSAIITGLEPGQYTVTEADASIEGWTWTVTGEGEVTVQGGQSARVTVTNTYTENETPKGSLTVNKVVNGGGDEAAEKVYTFNVTGPDGYSETVTVTGSGSAIITGLEPGQYTVTEADASIEGWTWTVTGEGEVTVQGGQSAEVTVTNIYVPDEDIPDSEIPEDNTPDSDIPEEGTPVVEIPEEDIPLTEIPDEDTPTADIPDEDVPLDDVPKTGDKSKLGLWLSLLAGSFSGLLALLFAGRKKEDEE